MENGWLNNSTFLNDSFQNSYSYDLADALWIGFMGVVGIVLNLSIIVVTALRKEIRKDYTIVILAQATTDLLFSAACAFLQPVTIMLSSRDDRPCAIAGFIGIYVSTLMVTGTSLVALNRVVAVCFSQYYQSIFGKRR